MEFELLDRLSRRGHVRHAQSANEPWFWYAYVSNYSGLGHQYQTYCFVTADTPYAVPTEMSVRYGKTKYCKLKCNYIPSSCLSRENEATKMVISSVK